MLVTKAEIPINQSYQSFDGRVLIEIPNVWLGRVKLVILTVSRAKKPVATGKSDKIKL